MHLIRSREGGRSIIELYCRNYQDTVDIQRDWEVSDYVRPLLESCFICLVFVFVLLEVTNERYPDTHRGLETSESYFEFE